MPFFPFLLFRPQFVINVLAAVLPAVFLMWYIYKKDTIEKEPRKLLINLILMGCLAGLASMILETVMQRLLDATMISPESPVYQILTAFIVVACVEEGTKFLLMKWRTFRHPAFNFMFDAVVYCVFTSLGFAALENILYVFMYGLSVAFMRAILSIPGHMAFAVVMGVFYGRAKAFDNYGDASGRRRNNWLAYLAAVILHGFYDACLMVGSTGSTILFFIFVVVMYVFIFRLIKKASAGDRPV